LARSVGTAGVALWDALIASRPASFELTSSVATPAVPPATDFGVSALTRIFFEPRYTRTVTFSPAT
jgi:hypothetical protein